MNQLRASRRSTSGQRSDLHFGAYKPSTLETVVGPHKHDVSALMFSSFHCLFFEWDRHSDYGAQRRFYQLADHRSDTDRYRPSIIFSSFHFSLFSFLPVIRRGFFGRRLDLHNDLVRLRTGVRVTDLSGSASASHQFTSLVSEESSFRRRLRLGGDFAPRGHLHTDQLPLLSLPSLPLSLP